MTAATACREVDTAAVRPLLGITAKSIHAPAAKTEFDPTRAADLTSAESDLKRRFSLQRTAAGLLYNAEIDINEQARIVGCCRHLNGNSATIWAGQGGKIGRFRGVVTCGSVWHCPICAQRIASKRGGELREATAAHIAKAGEVYLMTLTFPHQIDHPLSIMLTILTDAVQRFKNSRAYKNVMKDAGRTGTVKALEVTYGAHGWHPHVHALEFARPGLLDNQPTDPTDYRGHVAALRDGWIEALIKTGLADSAQLNDLRAHAFQLQNGDYAADYASKFGREPLPTTQALAELRNRWGLAREMTGWISKTRGRGIADYAGFTAFGLLADYRENNDRQSGALYIEYAEAFQGKRQMTWSPGLRKSLTLPDELTDLAAAEANIPDQVYVCQVSANDWKLILAHDQRFQVLWYAAHHGATGVAAILTELREREPTHQSQYRTFTKRRH